MKTLFFSLILSIASFVAMAQNPIDGNWKGSRETPNGTFEVNYTFKVEGDKLTGTWKTQFGEAKIEEGKVEGKKNLLFHLIQRPQNELHRRVGF